MNIYKRTLQLIEEAMLNLDAVADDIGSRNLQKGMELSFINGRLASLHSDLVQYYEHSGYMKEIQRVTVSIHENA